MRSDIRVSFKDNSDEDKLYDDIIENSKYIGKSAWMKIAAREKLERDKKEVQPERKNELDSVINTGGIISSMDEFFK